jgi:hypothetical protein
MPRTFHIDADNGLITIRLSGALAPTALRELTGAIAAHPRYHPALPQLVDCRGLELEAGPTDQRALASQALRFYRVRSQRSSVAIVVDADLEGARMAGLFRLACALQVAELFEDYDQALRWLMRREFAVPLALRDRAPAAGATATARSRL